MALDPLRFSFQSLLNPTEHVDFFNYGKADIQTPRTKKQVPPVENPSSSASAESHYELAANDFWKLLQGEKV